MTDNTPADNAWTDLEENPEKTDASPEIDDDASELARHNGSATTTTGGKSLSELTAKL